MLTRPRDREVVCHASAWDMDPATNDVRIKMCMKPTEEDLYTIYHELGHVYYYLQLQRRSRTCSATARTTASTRRSATR